MRFHSTAESAQVFLQLSLFSHVLPQRALITVQYPPVHLVHQNSAVVLSTSLFVPGHIFPVPDKFLRQVVLQNSLRKSLISPFVEPFHHLMFTFSTFTATKANP